ncbi:MAG: polyphosphate polymerase domain-containing protein [Hominimerdicola sp.]
MSDVQEIFKRVEKKYIVDEDTYLLLMGRLDELVVKDRFHKSSICNIYYDTPTSLLIRNSIEKPCYKEKLRLRSYGVPDMDDNVFLELKKKYKGIVYKRRVDMTLAQAKDFLEKRIPVGKNPQIENEIFYFLDFYKEIIPAMYLSYDRLAYVGAEDSNLRITFDTNITYRTESIYLEKGIWGKKLTDSGTRVMEIKIPGAMPLWLSKILDDLKIYPSSMSKYGTAYETELNQKLKGKVIDCA